MEIPRLREAQPFIQTHKVSDRAVIETHFGLATKLTSFPKCGVKTLLWRRFAQYSTGLSIVEFNECFAYFDPRSFLRCGEWFESLCTQLIA